MVEAELEALRRHGFEAEVFAARTDELQTMPFYRARTAARVASGIGRSPARAIRAFEPDIVHVHNTFPNLGRTSVARIDRPLVHTLHNYRPLCANGMLFRDGAICTRCPDGDRWAGVRHRCYHGSRVGSFALTVASGSGPAADTLLTKTDAVVVLSEKQRQIYLAAGISPDKLVLRPNFLPRHLDVGYTGAHAARRGWVVVGRLDAEKGVEELLRHWPPEERLVIVGAGERAAAVEQLAAGRDVEVIGQLARAEVVRLLARSEGLVFPSLCFESFGLAYIEALSAGVPVLAFEPSTVADAVRRERTGVVASWTTDGIRSACAHLRAGGDRLRRSCRASFEQSYTESIFLEHTSRLYELAKERYAEKRAQRR